MHVVQNLVSVCFLCVHPKASPLMMMMMMMMQLTIRGMGSSSLPAVVYSTGADITMRGGGETHVHKLHVHSHQPQQPSLLVFSLFLSPTPCVCVCVYSSMKLAWLSARISPYEKKRTHTCTHFQPRDISESPMSPRLDVSHGITSTSTSLQGPEGQRQRQQWVLRYKTSLDPMATVVTTRH